MKPLRHHFPFAFDLDNTLLAMEQDLGSDQWWDWQRRLQGLFGPDHFQLPDQDRPEGCAEPAD